MRIRNEVLFSVRHVWFESEHTYLPYPRSCFSLRSFYQHCARRKYKSNSRTSPSGTEFVDLFKPHLLNLISTTELSDWCWKYRSDSLAGCLSNPIIRQLERALPSPSTLQNDQGERKKSEVIFPPQWKNSIHQRVLTWANAFSITTYMLIQ